MHYDVVSNGVLWFLLPRPVRPRPPPPLRPPLPRGVGRVRRRQRRRSPTRSSPTRAEGDIVLVQDYQLALVPGQLRGPRPDLRVVHFTHTPFCGPDDDPRAARPTSPRRCARRSRAVPRGFHTERWADAYDASARAVARPRAVDRRAVRGAARPRRRRARRGRRVADGRAAAARELADAVGDRLVILRTDRIEPSKNIVRGFLAFDRLLEARPGAARAGRVRRDALPVAPGARRVPRVRERGRAGRRARQRPVGDARLEADRARRPRRLRPSVAGLQRYDVLVVNPFKDGLNLVAKEGPLVQPPRRRAVPVARGGRVRGAARRAAIAVHPYDIEQTARRAPHRAVDARRRARAAGREPARARRRCTRRAPGSTTSSATRAAVIASASVAEQRRASPAGPSTRRRPRADLGRASADARRCAPRARAAVGGQRVRARRTREGRRRRHPRTRRPHRRATSSATVVPLSTGTGGRSSTAMRPRSGASSP